MALKFNFLASSLLIIGTLLGFRPCKVLEYLQKIDVKLLYVLSWGPA